MICQRCKIAHGEPQRGAYVTDGLAKVVSDMCEQCASEIEYTGFLHRRAGIEASADSYGISDGYAGTMFEVEGEQE